MNLEQEVWFQRLAEPEQRDIRDIVQKIYGWASGTITRGVSQDSPLKDYFFALYAVGSVTSNKQNPTDTDLLLVTDKFPNIILERPYFRDLITILNEDGRVCNQDLDQKIKYFAIGPREKYDIQSNGPCKPIDLIYQWGFDSIESWEKVDPFKESKAKLIFNIVPKKI